MSYTSPVGASRPFFLFRFGPVRLRAFQVLLRHIVVICLLVVMLYPIAWLFVASLHTGESAALMGVGLNFAHLSLVNYGSGLTGTLDFSRLFLNSLLVAILEVIGALFSCTLAAYAFARLRFPLKGLLFSVLIAALLIPGQVLIVPQFILFYNLHVVGTYIPLILPHYLGIDAFFIFLEVQFIRTLPRELDDAARIDGCSHLAFLLRVVVPLSLPALATVAMFMFINSWNDLLGPLLYLSNPHLYTVPLGLSEFIDNTGQSSYGGLYAMSFLSLVPVAAFFLAGQRFLVQGIATTGLK